MSPGPGTYVHVRCISCCGYSRPTDFRIGHCRWLPGESSRCIHWNCTCTWANLKQDGQQIGLEKYKFYNDPLHVVKWKITYINMKLLWCVVVYKNLDNSNNGPNYSTLKWDLFVLPFTDVTSDLQHELFTSFFCICWYYFRTSRADSECLLICNVQ